MSKRAKITTAIRARIASGQYAPGQQLPTVAEVCDEFDVSTSTAVYAMQDLGELVDPRQGIGYFVSPQARELLEDDRPESLVRARADLLTIRAELDRIIERLAA